MLTRVYCGPTLNHTPRTFGNVIPPVWAILPGLCWLFWPFGILWTRCGFRRKIHPCDVLQWGNVSNRYALGEVFDFAQKVKATVVEPCFSNGRMGSCKDIDNITVRGALLGEVYELKKLRRIAPVMPYAEFVNISQRFQLGETKAVCLHAGTGGSHCVGIENRCKKDLGTFGFVPGVKVLEIHSYRKTCLKGYRTPPEFLVKDLHFLDKTLDFVDNTLMPLLKLQTGQFHAYHWRSELMKKHSFLLVTIGQFSDPPPWHTFSHTCQVLPNSSYEWHPSFCTSLKG